MTKISKKADYAVLIMASMAADQAAHDASGQFVKAPPVSAQEIAAHNGLSRPLCANLLKMLTRAGLVASVRGVGGGYRLARPSFEISLAQILEAVEGPMRLVECAGPEHDHEICSLTEHCPSRSAMRLVHTRIANLMAQIQLPELLEHEHRGSLATGSPHRSENQHAPEAPHCYVDGKLVK